MSLVRKLMMLMIILILGHVEIFAQWSISVDQLKKHGVDYAQFKPAILSRKGDFFIGYDFLDFEHRKKGLVYALRIVHLKKKSAIDIKTVFLPIRFFVGIALTDNEQSAIVVGDYGTKIIKVDLKTLETSVIFQYQKGMPGFRVTTLVVSHRNKIYMNGYFYDSEQYWQGDYIVELAQKNGDVHFIKKINLTRVYHRLRTQPRIIQLISGDVLYFVVLKRNRGKSRKRPSMYLVCYKRGRIMTIKKAMAIGNFAGTEERIYASVRINKTQRKTFMKKVNGSKVWPIGKKDVSYTYPFISEDGKTVVFCTMDILGQKMSVYYAQEKDGYKKRTLVRDAPIGPMRLSGNGKVYLMMNLQGIRVDFVKSLSKE